VLIELSSDDERAGIRTTPVMKTTVADENQLPFLSSSEWL
jgi:hypothetical protein